MTDFVINIYIYIYIYIYNNFNITNILVKVVSIDFLMYTRMYFNL